MTSRQCRMLWPLYLYTLLIVVIHLIGCTVTLPLKPTLPPPTEGTKIPVTIGVYYSAEFRTYQHVSARGGDRWIFPLGTASVALFDQVFPRVFASTKAVQSRPPLPPSDGALTAIIEPRIETFDYQLAGFIGGTVTVEITYRFTLHSPRGDPIASWVVKGMAGTFARIDKVTNLAMRDAATKFPTSFEEVPEVRRWLRQVNTPGVGWLPWRLHALFKRG